MTGRAPSFDQVGTESARTRVDHLVPVARGGVDAEPNRVSTSTLRNSAEAHWTLDELGWSLTAPGNHRVWEGLSGWFVGYVEAHPELMAVKYLPGPLVPRDDRGALHPDIAHMQ